MDDDTSRLLKIHLKTQVIATGRSKDDLAVTKRHRTAHMQTPAAAAKALASLVEMLYKMPQANGKQGEAEQQPSALPVQGTPTATTTPAGMDNKNKKTGQTPLGFTQDEVVEVPLVMPVLGPVLASMAEDFLPSTVQLPLPEEALKEAIAASNTLSRVEDRDALLEEVKQLTQQIATCQSAKGREALQGVLDDTQRRAKKSTKDSPDLDEKEAGLLEVKSKLHAKAQERLRRATEGAERTAGRVAARIKHFHLLHAQLSAFTEALASAEKRHAAEHARRQDERADHEASVMALVEQAIAEVQEEKRQATAAKLASQTSAAAAASAPQPFAPVPPSPPTMGWVRAGLQTQPPETAAQQQLTASLEECGKMRKQMEEFAELAAKAQQEATAKMQDMQAQLASAQQEAALAQAATQAAPEPMAQSVVDLTAPITVSQEIYERENPEITPAMLPTPTMPKGNELAAASRAHSLLETWVLAGSNYIFDYATFDQCTKMEGGAVGLFSSFLGDAVMGKWHETKPTPTDLVPKRLAQLLYMNLSRIRDLLNAEATIKAEVDLAFEVIVNNSKKRRAQWNTPAASVAAEPATTTVASSAA